MNRHHDFEPLAGTFRSLANIETKLDEQFGTLCARQRQARDFDELAVRLWKFIVKSLSPFAVKVLRTGTCGTSRRRSRTGSLGPTQNKDGAPNTEKLIEISETVCIP